MGRKNRLLGGTRKAMKAHSRKKLPLLLVPDEEEVGRDEELFALTNRRTGNAARARKSNRAGGPTDKHAAGMEEVEENDDIDNDEDADPEKPPVRNAKKLLGATRRGMNARTSKRTPLPLLSEEDEDDSAEDLFAVTCERNGNSEEGRKPDDDGGHTDAHAAGLDEVVEQDEDEDLDKCADSDLAGDADVAVTTDMENDACDSGAPRNDSDPKVGNNVSGERHSSEDRERCNTAAVARRVSNPAIEKLLRVQRTILKERVKKMSPHSLRKSRSAVRHLGLDQDDSVRPLSLRETWELYVSSLPPSFLSSAESQLDIISRVSRGQPAYEGLAVHAGNCADVKEMFDIGWKSKLTNSLPITTYDQFRVFVGQLCRFSVATKLCSLGSLYKRGSVYNLMTHTDAIKAFMGYFEVRCAAGTVLCKATHAINLCRYASAYLSSLGNKSTEIAEIGLLCEYLRSTARANKTVSRNQSMMRKSEQYRTVSGKVIAPQDFEDICGKLLSECKAMISGVQSAVDTRPNGRSSIAKYILEKNNFMEKWCLHFLTLCIMFGGGQRPQVFTLIERVEVLDFKQWEEEIASRSYFAIKISNEKRIRSIEVPHVLFPGVVVECFKFHLKYILPVLYYKRGVEKNDERRRYMFLHTITGDVLDSANVTATLRRYMKSHDPEMGNITTMDVRASFASMMLTKFRAGKVFQQFEESDFLEYLAKMMNTSYEQLRDTYIGMQTDDFHTRLSKVMRVMDSALEGDDAGSRSDVDNEQGSSLF